MPNLQLILQAIALAIGFLAGNIYGNYKLTKVEYRHAIEQKQLKDLQLKELSAQAEKQTRALDAAHNQTNAAIVAANRSGESAARLRQQLARIRAAAKADTTRDCKTASGSIDLLTDMLGRMEQHGRELAQEADRRGIAGAACEAIIGR